MRLKELGDALPAANGTKAAAVVEGADGEAYSSSEDENLPPLHRNTNRPIREYTYSDDSSSEDEA